MTRFTGIIPPICTPLDASGAVDAASLERLIERQLAAGVHGLFALGSTGEAIYLNDDDRERVLDVVVGVVAGAVPVFAGALAGTPARVIEQVRWIERYAVEALVVTAPFYASVSDRETITHFEAIAGASALPVIAYDIPGNVGHKLSSQVCIELLSRAIVVGLKDSSGIMDDFVSVLAGVGAERSSSILTGSDVRALESLDAGADGIVPGIGNLCPEHFVELYSAYQAGDRVAAERAQDSILAMTKVFGIGAKYGIGRHASELGGLKHVLFSDGVIASPRLSIPLAEYPEEAGREVLALVEGVRR
jgi:4-hydroxy-tetrahydrodipicolinate synthase